MPRPVTPHTPLLSTSSRQFWLLQVLGWLAYFALNFLGAIGYGKPLAYGYVSLASAGVGLVITSLLRPCYRRVLALGATLPAGLWASGLLLLATAVYTKVYAEVIFRYCFDCRPSSALGYLGYFGGAFYVLLSWSGLYFGIQFARQLTRERERALRAQSAAHEAQLKMLRYQLNPHFLFNTLNAISTLVLDGRGEIANRMVTGLSGFLRYTLDSDPMQRVTLDEELGAMSRYLGVEQLRFGERLQVRLEVSDEARAALVPSLVLQPLIENCIKHAVARRIEGGSIEVAARREGEELVLRVADDGPAQAEAAAAAECGVGLSNTRERLRVLYGAHQQVLTRHREPHGFEVELRLPYDCEAGWPG